MLGLRTQRHLVCTADVSALAWCGCVWTHAHQGKVSWVFSCMASIILHSWWKCSWFPHFLSRHAVEISCTTGSRARHADHRQQFDFVKGFSNNFVLRALRTYLFEAMQNFWKQCFLAEKYVGKLEKVYRRWYFTNQDLKLVTHVTTQEHKIHLTMSIHSFFAIEFLELSTVSCDSIKRRL